LKTASANASAKAAKYLAVLALGLCALVPAHAQSSKIAWLSTERIYNESRLAKLAGDKLAEEFRSREKAMQDLASRLKSASEKLEKELPALGEADRVKRQREYFELD
jgi:outer membrane protein